MAQIPAAAVEHYTLARRTRNRALRAATRAWGELRAGALTPSWRDVLPALVLEVGGAQYDAALSGASYAASTLAAQGSWEAPRGFVDPRAFVGRSSSGASLEAALYSPIPAVKNMLAAGVPLAKALDTGRTYLEQIIKTQVSDAGRAAASVDVAARPSCSYTRMLNPPSCDRCIVLAGRIYRWNDGFKRHPRCDCVHVATMGRSLDAARREGLVDDPYEYFRSLDDEAQDAVFGPGSAQAIRDGADIYQVVNSRRGVTGLFTTEGTTRRGNAGALLRPGQRRMTPDGIYRTSRTREEALQALRDQGYILPGGQTPGGSLRGRVDGFGQMGRGGTRRAASEAVLRARQTGVRDPAVRYTMTAAEQRLHDAERRYLMVLEGKNPYASPAFGNTPDPTGSRRAAAAGTRAPLTPQIAAQVENDYRRWLYTRGEIFAD